MNPCSVPAALRLVIPTETPEQQELCALHDAAYAAGGTRRDRAVADARFLIGLLETGMNVDLAEQYHTAVRVCGRFHWTGGYTDDPPDAPRAIVTPETP